jgi:plastocyanin
MRSLVRRGAGRLAVVVSVALAGCGDDPAGPSGPVATNQVAIRDDRFDPPAIVVAPGTTVTWTWSGANEHNVNFASALITDGPNQTSGIHATAMPTAVGTYAYQCEFHTGMSGTVQVQ